MTTNSLSHATPRRRRTHNEPSRKATFRLRESILEVVRELADQGVVQSASVFVEEALEQKLRDLRRERLYAAYDEAANDPAFVREMEDTTRAFDNAVGDGLADTVRV